MNWLNLQGAWVFEQRMDKRTRGKRGVPDRLACVDGRFLAIELKVTGNTLQREQEMECERIHWAGGIVCGLRPARCDGRLVEGQETKFAKKNGADGLISVSPN